MTHRSEQGRSLYELGLRLGGLGTVAIGCAGGSLARALARSAACGVALAGGTVKLHDGSCAACGVWLSRYYGLAASLFIRQEGAEITLHLRDGRGNPFVPEPVTHAAPCTGDWELLSGADRAWAARQTVGIGMAGAAAMDGPEGLRLLLERMGCAVVQSPRDGVPRFLTDREGFTLTVEHGGRVFRPEGEDALACAVHYARSHRAVPAFGAEGELL